MRMFQGKKKALAWTGKIHNTVQREGELVWRIHHVRVMTVDEKEVKLSLLSNQEK